MQIVASGQDDSAGRRVALYGRVSSKGQADEGLSLEAQEEILRTWAGHQYPAASVELYFDRGRKARSDNLRNRPEFRRLSANVEAGALDAVAAVRSDRYARNTAVYLTFQQLCHVSDVALWITNSGRVDTTAAGQFSATMIAGMAQFESDVKSERIREVQQAQRAKGLPTSGGRTTFGLRRIPKTPEFPRSRGFEPDENAPYVAEAFVRFARDPNLTAVARWLSDVRGVTLSDQAACNFARRILRNRHYLGEIKAGREWLPGIHERLIDAPLFEQVQAILDHNVEAHAKPARTDYFAGLIRHECGRRMPFTVSRQDQRSYSYRRCPVCTGSSHVRAAVVDHAIVTTIDGFLIELAVALDDPSFAGTKLNVDEIARLDAEHAKADQAVQRLSRALADPEQPETEIRTQLREAAAVRTRVAAALDRARGTGQTLRERLEALLPTVETFDYGTQQAGWEPPPREPQTLPDEEHHWFSTATPEERAEAAKTLLRGVTVFDAGHVEISFKHGLTLRCPLGTKQMSGRLLRGLEGSFGFGVRQITQPRPRPCTRRRPRR